MGHSGRGPIGSSDGPYLNPMIQNAPDKPDDAEAIAVAKLITAALAAVPILDKWIAERKRCSEQQKTP